MSQHRPESSFHSGSFQRCEQRIFYTLFSATLALGLTHAGGEVELVRTDGGKSEAIGTAHLIDCPGLLTRQSYK